jgi:hypothetical protein
MPRSAGEVGAANGCRNARHPLYAGGNHFSSESITMAGIDTLDFITCLPQLDNPPQAVFAAAHEACKALPRLTPVWENRFLALDGVRARFSPEALPLGLIYLFAPRSDDANAPRVEEKRPREALLNLVQNTYMNWLLDRLQRAVEFDALSRLVQQVPVRRIVPHRDAGRRIAALCELIQKDAAALLMERKPSFCNVRT